MNQSLTLTGSPGALAAALAAFADFDVQHIGGVITNQPLAIPAMLPSGEAIVPHGTYVPVTDPSTYTPVIPEVAAAAPTISGEPQFDTSGLVWDARIHSAKMGTTGDGKWRKKRDVDPNYYNAIEAELRATHGHPMPTPVAPVQPVPMPIPMPVAVVQGNEPIPMAQPSAPVPMAYGAVVAAPAASEPVPTMPVQGAEVTMHDIMTHVGQNMPTGLITPDYLVALTAEINQQHGLAMQSFSDMAANPGAIAYAWAAFARDGKR